jgi:hypothetical protein
MTDEKNIKALEDYIKENEFEYFHSNMMGEYPLIKKSLDIINRQKAEIEALYQINTKSEKEIYELRKELLSKENLEESFKKAVKDCDKRLEKTVKLERAAAYKRFADKLEEKCGIFTPLGVNWIEEAMAVRVSDIDKILKEMVGEEE